MEILVVKSDVLVDEEARDKPREEVVKGCETAVMILDRGMDQLTINTEDPRRVQAIVHNLDTMKG
ncbi:hypothetical protein [Bacillus velezensis]|uniref:hypothetical protein n=1 Tax=Bacillus velezensis TaxID=492670 RepID=UPI002DBAB2A3|nr:hypothetical protein [Bacillus velezensis]MEC2287408.1 hypothetical protein [Bacillus velezensis]MEC2422446.1 hypothetical protein [Bacillus velezensis]